MKSIQLLCAISILTLGAVACSGDDKGGSTGSADAQAYVTSCKSLCQKQTTGNCSAYSTVAECNADCDTFASTTGDCAAKLKAYGACTDAATDACAAETDCATQASAWLSACQ